MCDVLRASSRRASLLLEGVAVAAIFALAAAVGGFYTDLFGGYARFEQSNYAPAVMVALGRGFVNPELDDVPGLEEFLRLDTRVLSITPADLPENLGTRPLEQTHVRWRYCLHLVGWIWRYNGVISWDMLTPLFAVLYGLTAVFAYLVFRLLLGWPLALAGTLLIIFSPANLYFLPHLRDYSKAPPILAAICAAGFLVKHGTSRTRTLATCLALGSFLGLMMGFRKDVFICVWPTLAVLFLFLPGGLRRRLVEKVLAASLLLASFYGTSWPLWMGMQEQGSTTGHVIIYGLLPPFDDFLSVGGVDYELAPASNDAYTSDIAGGYAERNFTGLGDDRLRIYTPEYDRACNGFLKAYVTTFPADILVRSYAAVLNKVRYGIFVASHESRYGPVRVPLIERLFTLRFNWLHGMSGMQIPLLLVCFLTLSAISSRYGLSFALIILYYCGITSLQFDLRHHFHLEILWWILPLYLVHAAGWMLLNPGGIRSLWRKKGGRGRLHGIIRGLHVPRMAFCAGLVAAVLFVPLVAARVYQRQAYAQLFSQYASGAVRPIEFETAPNRDPRLVNIRLKPSPEAAPATAGIPKWFMKQRLLMMEFDGRRDVSFNIYAKESRNGVPGLSYRCLARCSGQPGAASGLRYFLPVYESGSWDRYRYTVLDSFEMWRGQEQEVKGIYEVVNGRSIPLWFMTLMTEDWGSRLRYKVLQNEMRPLHFRALRAAADNLAVNGGFENWDNGVPQGFTGSGSTFEITREENQVSSGRAAVRQEWTVKGDGSKASNPFGCFLGSLEPATIYEVIVSARNMSGENILLTAWDVPMTESGEMDNSLPPTRLKHPVLRVVPCMEYSTYWGTFTTSPAPHSLVYLCVEPFGKTKPAVVYWDDWRVHQWPGPREAWDFNQWVHVGLP